jgi:TPR repeat protein
MHMIGVLYQEGWGVPQDNQQAAIWYRREDAFSESSKNLPAPTVKAPPQPAPPVVQPTTPNVASEAADAEANAQAMTATFLIFLAQPQYGVNPNDAVIAGAWHDWHEHITAYFPGRDRYSITPAEWKEFAADGFVRPAGWLQGLIGSQATTKP